MKSINAMDAAETPIIGWKHGFIRRDLDAILGSNVREAYFQVRNDGTSGINPTHSTETTIVNG